MPTSSTTNPVYFEATYAPEPAWPFATTNLAKPMVHVITVYYIERSDSASAPTVFAYNLRFDERLYGELKTVNVKRLYNDSLSNQYVMVAWETMHDRDMAVMSGKYGSGSATFNRNRARFLALKEKGKLHPMDSSLMVLDEVFFVEGDPRPVDGEPTLFMNKADAELQAVEMFPGESHAKAKERVKSRKVFTHVPD